MINWLIDWLIQLQITEFIPTLLYFGYSALMCFTFWLLTGTIGFYSAYLFVAKIYGAIKIDWNCRPFPALAELSGNDLICLLALRSDTLPLRDLVVGGSTCCFVVCCLVVSSLVLSVDKELMQEIIMLFVPGNSVYFLLLTFTLFNKIIIDYFVVN